jgi:hypothetical protein
LGTASLAAAVAAVPRDAGRASSASPMEPLARSATPLARALAWSKPKRNPFAGDPAAVASPSMAALAATSTITSASAPPVGVPTPPPFGVDAAPRVTAIVSGTHPVAIVEVNAHARLVTPGARIAGRTIVAIDADGILLDDGSALQLASPGRTRSGAP